QAPYGAVERAGAQAYPAAGALGDLLEDRGAVAVAVRRGDQDVQGVARESEGRHASTIAKFAIASKGVARISAGGARRSSGTRSAAPRGGARSPPRGGPRRR